MDAAYIVRNRQDKEKSQNITIMTTKIQEKNVNTNPNRSTNKTTTRKESIRRKTTIGIPTKINIMIKIIETITRKTHHVTLTITTMIRDHTTITRTTRMGITTSQIERL